MGNKTALSFKAISSKINEVTQPDSSFEYLGFKITVRKNISYENFTRFIYDVVESCFDENGEYNPSAQELFIKYGIIKYYTNIGLPEDVGEKEANYIFNVIYNSDIVSKALTIINQNQISDLYASIDRLIDYRIKLKVNVLKAETESAAAEIKRISENLDDILGNITKEDLSKLVDTIINNSIDEKKLALELYKENNKK